MAHLPVPSSEARRILELARSDRRKARAVLSSLAPEAQAELVAQSPVGDRVALLDLVDDPEKVVPALPPADLSVLARSIGIEDAGWLLACASEEQLQAAMDLDTWTGFLPDRRRFGDWLAALADAGEDTLLRTVRAVDFEVLVLQLRHRAQVVMKSGADDWEAPGGGLTMDGIFYLVSRNPDDDLEDLMGLLQALFSNEYWTYFRLVQGGLWELDTESEEWALRWRSGRLMDLGFPNPEDAKRIYAVFRGDARDALPDPPAPSDTDTALPVPVSMPPLPVSLQASHAFFRALAEMPEAARDPIRRAFLWLANRIAMADDLPLGEPETLPDSVDKATRLVSRGLEHLSERHGLTLAETLLRVPVERLFRIGHSLAPEAPLQPGGRPLGGDTDTDAPTSSGNGTATD